MLKETYEVIKERYGSLIVTDRDARDAIDFTHELLKAEADYLKETAPDAWRTLQEYEKAIYIVFNLAGDIDDGRFDELEDFTLYCQVWGYRKTKSEIIAKAQETYDENRKPGYTKEDALAETIDNWDIEDMSREENDALLAGISGV